MVAQYNKHGKRNDLSPDVLEEKIKKLYAGPDVTKSRNTSEKTGGKATNSLAAAKNLSIQRCTVIILNRGAKAAGRCQIIAKCFAQSVI